MKKLETQNMPIFDGYCSPPAIKSLSKHIAESAGLAYSSMVVHADMMDECFQIQDEGGTVNPEQLIMVDQQAKLAQSYLDIVNELSKRKEVAVSILN